VTSYL